MQPRDFISSIDGQTYRMAWDPDVPVLRVTPVTDKTDRGQLVAIFEEGRAAHPTGKNPYTKNDLHSAAWAFGQAVG